MGNGRLLERSIIKLSVLLIQKKKRLPLSELVWLEKINNMETIQILLKEWEEFKVDRINRLSSDGEYFIEFKFNEFMKYLEQKYGHNKNN